MAFSSLILTSQHIYLRSSLSQQVNSLIFKHTQNSDSNPKAKRWQSVAKRVYKKLILKQELPWQWPNAYAPWDLTSDQQLQQLQQLQQRLELNSIIKPGWQGEQKQLFV